MDEQLPQTESWMFQNQILQLNEANVKLQNEIDELLEQYGRCPYIRINGIPKVSN